MLHIIKRRLAVSRYEKGVPFLSKVVCKWVRGWTLARSIQHFWLAPTGIASSKRNEMWSVLAGLTATYKSCILSTQLLSWCLCLLHCRNWQWRLIIDLFSPKSVLFCCLFLTDVNWLILCPRKHTLCDLVVCHLLSSLKLVWIGYSTW